MRPNNIVISILVLFFVALAACLALFYGSSGCGSSTTLETGEQTIVSDGVERIYYVKLPANYNANKLYPLIFAFHGLGGDYTNFSEGYYDLQDIVGEGA